MPDAGLVLDWGALGLPGCAGRAARGTAAWPASPLIAPTVAGPIAGAAAALHDRPSYGTLRHRYAAAVLLVVVPGRRAGLAGCRWACWILTVWNEKWILTETAFGKTQ